MYDIEKITMAATVKEAVTALKADPTAVVISGGSDVLIKIRAGKLAGCRLVCIRNIPEMHGISIDKDGTICIRPAMTFTEVSENKIILEHIPVLAYAVDQVGSPQIRNIGTIGGNISNGVTSADSASTLCALNAEVEITGLSENGADLAVRRVPILEYYVKAGKVCLGPGEICTGIYIKKENYEGWRGYYFKYGKRNAMEIATLGCSVLAKLSKDLTTLEDIHLAYGVANPVPMRCFNAEKALRGQKIDAALYEKIGQLVEEEIHPRDSWRASKDFRLHMAKVMPVRALEGIIENAKKGLKGGSNAKVGLIG